MGKYMDILTRNNPSAAYGVYRVHKEDCQCQWCKEGLSIAVNNMSEHQREGFIREEIRNETAFDLAYWARKWDAQIISILSEE